MYSRHVGLGLAVGLIAGFWGQTSVAQQPVKAAAAGQAVEAPGRPLPLPPAVRAAIAKQHPTSVADLRAIQQQVRKVVERVRPTVVAVQIGGSVGSGVIVSEDGLVLTAGHVAVRPNLPVTFFFPDGSRARGRSLGLNRSIDSGMVRITDEGPWPHTPMATPGALTRGDWVVTLGQPNGFDEDRAPPVRLGRVLSADDEVIHSDCTLVGGDSGGPLLNLKGEVVGIHSRIAKAITSNFHVPIAAYRTAWDQLLAGQEWDGVLGGESGPRPYPWIGFAGERGRTPFRVTQVYPDGPAASAGVREGDVVRKLDGERVDTYDEFILMTLRREPDKKVMLEILRDGRVLQIEVLLGRSSGKFPGSLGPRKKS